MMEALVKCTPRMEFTFDDKRCTGVQYTPEQGCYLDWCENVHRLFVHRRIDSNEANSQGFDGKTLNRSSREQTYLVRDNRSTRGRLYSACDREDIVNRSFVIAFTPDLCTLVPVTDEGHGYVQCANVQTTIEQGQNAHTSVSMRTGRVRIRTTDGFWVTFTDVQTGRLYVAFTESKRRADRMVACTGIIGCTDEDWTSGQFGPNAVKLISSSVLQFTSTFAYAGIVKFVVRRLFEMLYKRPVTRCALVWQDRRMRHSFGMDNGIPLYSIYKSNEHLFSDVEADIIEVELTPIETLVEMYKHTDSHERRAEMFRNLRYMKNGTLVHCGRKMYKRMAEQLYRKMGKLIESTDV
jgi:translation initiation factor IF-1